jgi:hypothetical protein
VGVVNRVTSKCEIALDGGNKRFSKPPPLRSPSSRQEAQLRNTAGPTVHLFILVDHARRNGRKPRVQLSIDSPARRRSISIRRNRRADSQRGSGPSGRRGQPRFHRSGVKVFRRIKRCRKRRKYCTFLSHDSPRLPVARAWLAAHMTQPSELFVRELIASGRPVRY